MSVTKWIIHFILNAFPSDIWLFPQVKGILKVRRSSHQERNWPKKIEQEPEAYTPLPHIPLPKKQLLKILWVMAESSGEVSNL